MTGNTGNLDVETHLSLGLWLRLMKCATAIERDMGRRLRREYGQSMSRFDVLSQLHRGLDQTLTVGELSKQLLAADGNISRLLDRMEEEKLLTRHACEVDRRSQRVAITAKGRQLFDQMAASHAGWANDLVGGLSTEDKKQLQSLLDRLRDQVN